MRFVKTTMVAAAAVLTIAPSVAMADDNTGALSLIPEDAVAVIAVDVERVKKSPLMEDAKMLPVIFARQLSAVEKHAKLDVMEDIDSFVMVAFSKNADDDFVYIAKGDFEMTIDAIGASTGLAEASTTLHGVDIVDLAGASALAQIGEYRVYGPVHSISRVAKAHAGKVKSLEGSKLLEGVDTSRDAWFVISIPERLQKRMAGDFPGGAQPTRAKGSINVSSGVVFDAAVSFTTADGAKAIEAIATEALAGLEPQAKVLKLSAAHAATTVQAHGKELVAHAELTADELVVVRKVVTDAFAKYVRDSKTSEGEMNLKLLGDGAVSYLFSEHMAADGVTVVSGVYPKTEGWVCTSSGGSLDAKTMPNDADFASGPFQELRFYIAKPHYFKYCYASSPDGTSFAAYADAGEVALCLKGVANNGNPELGVVLEIPVSQCEP